MALTCSLDVDDDGDQLSFSITVENTGSDPLELTFPDGQTVEVVVTDEGQERWRYGAEHLFTQAVREVTLDPGEQLIEHVAWADPPSGTFDAEVTLCATEATCSAVSTITR